MMSKTLGAPLGGTTVGGQYGLESFASMLIVPPNGAGGGGRYLPSIVVVALGEPGVPVVCCARAAPAVSGNSTSTASKQRRGVRMATSGSFIMSLLNLLRQANRPLGRTVLVAANAIAERRAWPILRVE